MANSVFGFTVREPCLRGPIKPVYFQAPWAA